MGEPTCDPYCGQGAVFAALSHLKKLVDGLHIVVT